MLAHDELLKQVHAMNPQEREFLLGELIDFQHASRFYRPFVREYPSIVKTPDVCGGAARLIRTRIPVWILVRMWQLGMTDAEILQIYPTLRAIDLIEAMAYAEEHPVEIEKAIRENEEE